MQLFSPNKKIFLNFFNLLINEINLENTRHKVCIDDIGHLSAAMLAGIFYTIYTQTLIFGIYLIIYSSFFAYTSIWIGL